MIEGRRVVAGEAILSGPAAAERSKVEHGDEACDRHIDAIFEALVREHSRLVYRIAYAVLRRHHDAEDATQETFLRVLRYSSKLNAVEDPKTWLARIAWRVAVDRSRQHHGKREIPLEHPAEETAEVASVETPADESVLATQVGATLEKLIAALPEKLRQALILSAIEELPPRQVGAALGINEAAVRSRVFRARQILRKKMTQMENTR